MWVVAWKKDYIYTMYVPLFPSRFFLPPFLKRPGKEANMLCKVVMVGELKLISHMMCTLHIHFRKQDQYDCVGGGTEQIKVIDNQIYFIQIGILCRVHASKWILVTSGLFHLISTYPYRCHELPNPYMYRTDTPHGGHWWCLPVTMDMGNFT